jgi:hypothetical protein
MLQRIQECIPPVSEAEFTELAAWFAANEEWLSKQLDSNRFLDLGNGRKVSCCNLRYALRQGYRDSGAGTVAEDLRQLRSCFGVSR